MLIRSAIETTAAVTSPASVAPGATVTFAATVTPATVTGAAFAGTVRFTFEDATTQDVAIDTDGTAEVDRTAPASGSLTATAEYLGGGYAPSAVSAVATTTVVVPAPTTIELTVTGGASSVAQGGSLTFTVTGEDAGGGAVFVNPSDITLTSSVPTDVVSALTVAFPHASPHTITARFGVAGPTSAVTIDVIPAAGGGGAGALGNTGREVTGEVFSAAALLGVGGVLVAATRRRRAQA